MAKRRRQYSGRKDDQNLSDSSEKKQNTTTNKVEEKHSASSEIENILQSRRQIKSVSPTSKLCIAPSRVELGSSTSKRSLRNGVSTCEVASSGERKNSLRTAKRRSPEKEETTEVKLSEKQPAVPPKVEDNDDEVVHDSQEVVNTDHEEEQENGPLIMEAESIFLLYENLCGEKYKHPEKSKNALRNEYRELFCVAKMCEKMSEIMTMRLESARQLRSQRLESLSQLKALLLRLQDLIIANLPTEKYLSFDDTAQRDALEIMNIRYEELSDDIFSGDDEFSTMFGNDDLGMKEEEQVLTLPVHSLVKYDSKANYADLCIQSKLTEVGLNYVNAVHSMIKRSDEDLGKCRALIAQRNSQIAACSQEVKSVREQLGDLAPIIDRIIGVTYIDCVKTSMFKSRST